MKRLIKVNNKDVLDDTIMWTKVKLDGPATCEECGTKVDGVVRWEKYSETPFCENCFQKIKDRQLEATFKKYITKKSNLFDTVKDEDTNSNYDIYINPNGSELKNIKDNCAMVIENDGTIYAWSGDLGLGGINSFLNEHSKNIDPIGIFSFIFNNNTFNIKGNNYENIIKNISKYESTLSQIHNLKSAYFYFVDLGYELEYSELSKSEQKELSLVGKAKDRGKDDEIINHMETSTKGKTLFAHRLLHMWFKNPSKTNWTKDQIKADHIKVVKAMFDFNMNHNIVDGLDKTLPQYLQDKSGKEK